MPLCEIPILMPHSLHAQEVRLVDIIPYKPAEEQADLQSIRQTQGEALPDTA